jgi:hypothetical protein
MRGLRGTTRGVASPSFLLFFKGLEQRLSELKDVESSTAAVDVIAGLTGTKLVVVETNLRDAFDPNYERYFCGAALASASLALCGGIGATLIPAGWDYGTLEPTGSHPLLDPLWSTERQQVIYDGAGSRRVDKIEELAHDWPESLAWLRVCLENRGGGVNCGRCRKCARTMVALDLLGVLPQATLFPPTLPPGTIALLELDHEKLLLEVTDLGRRIAPGSRVTRELEGTLTRRRRRAAFRALCENTPLLASALDLVDRVRGAGRHHVMHAT